LRDEGRAGRRAPGAREEALLRGLTAVLQELPNALPALGASELLLALNAMGQVARAWSWLGTGDGVCGNAVQVTALAALVRAAELLGVEAHWQQQVADVRPLGYVGNVLPSGHTRFSARDLALLMLAHARVLRRGSTSSEATPVLAEVCERLTASAPATTGLAPAAGAPEASLKPTSSTATAAISAGAMLLMHVARHLRLGDTMPEPGSPAAALARAALACVAAWAPAARRQPEVFKAVAAAAGLGGQLLRLQRGAATGPPPAPWDTSQQLAARLAHALHALLAQGLVAGRQGAAEGPGGPVPPQEQGLHAELLESWHLDSCLFALAVSGAIGGQHAMGAPRGNGHPARAAREHWEDAVIAEVCRRQRALSERSIRFWLVRLCEPSLLEQSSLPSRLCRELLHLEAKGPKMHIATAAALRDCAFVLGEV